MIIISINSLFSREDLIDRLNRHLEWIKSCDTKASIVLAVTGIFLTIFSSSISIKVLKEILANIFQNLSFSNLLYLIIFLIGWGAFVYGVICLIKVLVPRLKNNIISDNELHDDSLIYFESVSNNTFVDFKNKMKTLNEENDKDDLLSQIYINSHICTYKYQHYSKGIKFTFTGMAITLVLFIIGIILLNTGGF